MKIRHVLVSSALVLSLAGCSADQSPDVESGDATAPAAATQDATGAAATDTQAFYGDEAPVVVDAPAEDDHGHAHDAEGRHMDEDDAHAHDAEGGHVDEADAHDHGDGSEPHDH